MRVSRLMETSINDEGATSSIRDKGVLTDGVEIRGETELSRTLLGDVAAIEANVADIEGADDSSGSSAHEEDETTT
ncbi:hypothetical protein Syun_029494 [Stephania yunnanensis]|uniref:Uncharacterized protein n=1 Tax=Stephania yunnanensis TaxID=152371 RepID=A0AAP0E5G9_9MAGN